MRVPRPPREHLLEVRDEHGAARAGRCRARARRAAGGELHPARQHEPRPDRSDDRATRAGRTRRAEASRRSSSPRSRRSRTPTSAPPRRPSRDGRRSSRPRRPTPRPSSTRSARRAATASGGCCCRSASTGPASGSRPCGPTTSVFQSSREATTRGVTLVAQPTPPLSPDNRNLKLAIAIALVIAAVAAPGPGVPHREPVAALPHRRGDRGGRRRARPGRGPERRQGHRARALRTALARRGGLPSTADDAAAADARAGRRRCWSPARSRARGSRPSSPTSAAAWPSRGGRPCSSTPTCACPSCIASSQGRTGAG